MFIKKRVIVIRQAPKMTFAIRIMANVDAMKTRQVTSATAAYQATSAFPTANGANVMAFPVSAHRPVFVAIVPIIRLEKTANGLLNSSHSVE